MIVIGLSVLTAELGQCYHDSFSQSLVKTLVKIMMT